jgi:hypothetical protein
MAIRVTLNDSEVKIINPTYDDKTNLFKDNDVETVGGMANGVVVAGARIAAQHADNAFLKATQKLAEYTAQESDPITGKLLTNKDGSKKMKTLTNENIAELNQLNKEGSIALAANQQFTALLNKIERVVQTS